MQEIEIFDLEPRELKVEIGDKLYILKECDGEATRKFRNAKLNQVRLFQSKLESNDSIVTTGMADLEIYLLTLCLWDDKGKLVPEHTIKTFPGRVTKRLYQKAIDISELDEKKVEIGRLFEKLLKEPSSPMNLQDFVNWIKSLNNPEYKTIIEYVSQGIELKN